MFAICCTLLQQVLAAICICVPLTALVLGVAVGRRAADVPAFIHGYMCIPSCVCVCEHARVGVGVGVGVGARVRVRFRVCVCVCVLLV